MSVCDRCQGDRGGCRCKENDRIADLERQLAEKDDLIVKLKNNNEQMRIQHNEMWARNKDIERQIAEAQADSKRKDEQIKELEAVINGFCSVLQEDNPVSAMVELQSLKGNEK